MKKAVALLQRDGFNTIIRSTRPEFWWGRLYLFMVEIFIAIMLTGFSAIFSNFSFIVNIVAIYGIFLLFLTEILGIILLFRRLNDANKSVWNILWLVLGPIGYIILLFLAFMPSYPKENRFGKYEKFEDKIV